ncbi:beta-galactosidase [Catenovulum agarivorans DS-2]|uniref:Beta-galactosidase n=1 Tax=Catenovulum agarivorans DS-2 TaxID=1328313 RepID=W7QCA3_9ALTE|nr:glycoside hydrolase family 2 TIM barrel-domain containing protein [Catenovulum agarivorans]EWH10519.1 beta-galactosidase [Catenovulum agarivorans DS-2]
MKSVRSIPWLCQQAGLLFMLLVSALAMNNAYAASQQVRHEINFNQDWKFKLGDHTAYKNKQHNDSGWTILDVPHDYIFEEGVSKDGSQKQFGGNHGGGLAWYRKDFVFDERWQGKRVFIQFDGVYMNSQVWLNGELLGKRPYGYISFQYDITEHLNKDTNVISVRVDNELQPSTRWYHPGGIYAPVKLLVVDPTHIKHNSLFVQTPVVGKHTQVQTAFELSKNISRANDYQVRYRVTDQQGSKVISNKLSLADIQQKNKYQFAFEILNAKRWNPHDAYLYNLTVDILHKGKIIDTNNTHFGVREIAWKRDTGFWINGKNVKIKGVAEHYEGGPVGGAWTKPLLRWKLSLLKDMGVNAIRLGHNPYPPMFYDLADELGIMLMDEIFDGWKQKARHDYGAHHFDKWWKTDLKEWVTRNRNHPSIIIYSVGNETHGDIAPELVKAVKEFDPTRLVTSGSTNKEGMDVVGINGGSEGKSFFKRRFERPFVSTEAPHTWQTRGYYRTQTWWRDGPKSNTFDLPNITDKEIFFYDWKDPKDWVNQKQHLNSSYDNATVRISARKNWEMARDLPHHSGHFRWTGFDYHGEAGLAHGGWPFIAFMGGALDLAGFKKDLFHFYRSQWSDEAAMHILPSWTHPTMAKGTKIPVWVYTNLDEVELFLNGKSLGRDKPGRRAEEMQCEWMVPWQPGTLTAIGYKNGQKVMEKSLKTAGAPTGLKHTVEVFDAESGFDTAKVISSQSVDEKQNFYPYGAHNVYYDFTDGVKVKALENGSPYEHTNRVRANFRPLFMGKNRAFVEIKYPQAAEYATIGAIVGDEALRLSNRVEISVQSVPLTEAARQQSQQIEVFYTINKPYAKQMQRYKQAFNVKDGDKVYAKVFVNGRLAITMEQSFGKGVGLFWGDEDSAKMWVGRGLSMQGEAAEYQGGAAAVTNAHGVHGGAYSTFNDKEGSMYWYHENDGEEGIYKAVFRYTHNDKSSKRPLAIYINGEKATVIKFEPTGSWDSKWSEEAVAEFKLVKGANHIEFKTMGNSGPNIDQFSLQ